MKKRRLGACLSAVVVAGTVAGGSAGSAAGIGTFEIGGFWQPPITVGGDFNTNANWADIAAAHFDSMVGVRQPKGVNINKALNETGIAYSSANNVKLLVTDSNIFDFKSYTPADYAALNAAVTPYLNDSRVKGLALRDEPSEWESEGFANSYKYIKSLKPSLEVYMNFYDDDLDYYEPGKLVLSNSASRGDGSYVSSTNAIGQTFKVPANMSYLDGIDMFIDMSQCSSSETLTLKLWNSSAKTSLLGQASVTGWTPAETRDNAKFPYFPVHATVTPGSTYYMELTHNGGGDNSVGWVIRSNANTYADGAAYEAGTAKAYDFFFRLYTKRDNYGTPFENHWDDWLNMSGADYILHDTYPFWGGTQDNPNYFKYAETVRDRGLANDVVYGAFLQSIQVANSAGVAYIRDPNMNMMRWNVYSYLTYGFKKLNWFTYWRPDDGDEYFSKSPVDADGTKLIKYGQVQTLNAEMKNLGNTLKNLTSRRVYHTGNTLPDGARGVPSNFFVKPADLTQPMIIGYFTDPSGRSYVMLTNRDYNNSKTLDFNFSTKPSAITEVSKTTGAEVSLVQGTYSSGTGVLNITLLPGEGRLFALPTGFKPYTNLAALASVTATSSYEGTADGWALTRINDDLRNSSPFAAGLSGSSNGWSSDSNKSVNHTESVTLDLGVSQTVSEVDLYPRNDAASNTTNYLGKGFPLDFTIQVATNAGGPWTTVSTQTNYSLNGNSVQPFTFSPQTARYIKVEGTNLRRITDEAGQPYRMQLAEIEAYASAQPTANLIGNPNFESAVKGPWYIEWHPANAGIEANYPHASMYDGYIWPTSGGDVAISQNITAPATKSYTLTVYCAANTGSIYLGVDVGGTQFGQANITANVGYAPYTITFSATAGQTIKVWYYGNSTASGGWATIDDVVLK
ncbi:discoidin domain-containing protein [Cohnella soli]|uniref:Discoidin domain-containing protein n=1 Tax=Cohnella soli TaxID=425005 RepID=A0ABW0I2G9_9BACL